MEKDRGALRLFACDALATRAGLQIGMTLAEARARLPALLTREADPLADVQALRALAGTCERFTPLVALRGTDGLMLDTTGCDHLFGGEEPLALAIKRLMRRLGFATRVALAVTPEAAWALARYTKGVNAPNAAETERLTRALPLTALEADTATTLALRRAGFTRIADLADRPSSVLSARFGQALADSLARLLGREDIRITPLRPAPPVSHERLFAEPLGDQESLLAALADLIAQACVTLEARGQGGRAFEALLFRADGRVQSLALRTAEPSRDSEALLRLFRLRLDTLADPLDPGFGFDALRLSVRVSEPLTARQPGLDRAAGSGPPEGEALAALIDRLLVRFGPDQVSRFAEHDSHDPARAGAIVSVLAPKAAGFPLPVEEDDPPTRPLTLFSPPQPVEVIAEVPDGPPLRFRWRRMLHEVTRAEGPERIAPEWWRHRGQARPARDYYRIEDREGRRFWLFREGLFGEEGPQPRWFIHGLFA